jgi:hypothetical protein
MTNLSLKQKIIGAIAIFGTVLILVFQRGVYSKPQSSAEKSTTTTPAVIQTDKAEIVSTNPSPLDQSIVLGSQPIEITFNFPLENIPELKYRFEPQSDLKVELLNDKKTVRFTPVKPLPFGMGFTLVIAKEAKFDGKKNLDKEYTFHFRTIEYKGV